MSLIDEIRIAQRNAGEDAVIRNLERQGLGSINPDASEEETKAPLLPGTRTHGERPDWLQYDYTSDVITIYGLAGEDVFFSLEGDLLRITRGPSGTFVLHIVEPSDQQQPAQPQQSCYYLNCEELSKELAALKTKLQDACCAECGKKESQGWALYCVECIDKLNALLGSIEQKVDTLITQTTPPSPKNHGDI